MKISSVAVALASTVACASAALLPRQDDGTALSSVKIGEYTYENHGLVAFGRLPHTATDKYGESLGGLGSAIALQSFNASQDGSYKASMLLQPDRGHNQGGAATSDYRARSHTFEFTFQSLSSNAKTPSAENLHAKYQDTLLYKYGSNFTTGLNPDAVRKSKGQTLPLATYDNHIPIDSEGLVIHNELLFVSDEYGPNVYVISRFTGHIQAVIQPPAAIVPLVGGKPNYTAQSEADTGRTSNQGFEGLTFDDKTNTLWALLQTATVQDGGKDKTTSSHTRLLGWQVNPLALYGVGQPKLKHEYVVSLPQSKKGKTRGASELHFLQDDTFLVLTRDGNGFGDTDSDSSFKNAALISTSDATNIAGTKYDSPDSPVSPGGQLVADIKAVQVQDFVDLVNKDQLAKFGLHTGGNIDQTLIASKLESLAVTSAQDRKNPDDYFLFTVSDNDFISTQGKQAGQINGTGPYVLQDYQDPYAVQYGSQDTQIFVYRISIKSDKKKHSKRMAKQTPLNVD
ncbi:unnamed protein product [Sympodiomycopsis kandeliae]